MSDDVSRETPSVPEAARRAFTSDRLSVAEQYTELLATEGVLRGLIGPREADKLWDRHVLNSAVLGEAIPSGATVCDIGTGAGLPGIVVAIARPDVTMTLVEPLLRRTTFLSEVVDELGLDHVDVVRGRAEDLHGERTFDIVTSRAVAPLDRLLGWSMPLVAPTGALVAMKGRSVHEEVEAARGLLETWRCSDPEVVELGRDVVDPPTTVLRVSWADPSRIGWPLARIPDRGRQQKKRRRTRREAQ
ncbi:16S rRNA (guanine(527)-N(7))-methyltransferase RsmG [Nocardioides KLBMP 9356]|uniref:Ribosomal RNA small subunit methyltransferase G n=1 Tax=Nocardioides potassii TaxID=2911371 RepID=A0ABS9HB73_9ACTN|nr:16S rRNA (guanine(527)-N(7))-methyltransferase RsmG [Nocardioides potassii]MCF6378452.1 16S rRNA (guanine(527)-N(7))-methyltransferase RsmG [Nocardioides potassii]